MQIRFLLRFLPVFEKSIMGFPQGFPQIYDRQNKANKSVILQQKDIPGREAHATSSRHFELAPSKAFPAGLKSLADPAAGVPARKRARSAAQKRRELQFPEVGTAR